MAPPSARSSEICGESAAIAPRAARALAAKAGGAAPAQHSRERAQRASEGGERAGMQGRRVRNPRIKQTGPPSEAKRAAPGCGARAAAAASRAAEGTLCSESRRLRGVGLRRRALRAACIAAAHAASRGALGRVLRAAPQRRVAPAARAQRSWRAAAPRRRSGVERSSPRARVAGFNGGRAPDETPARQQAALVAPQHTTERHANAGRAARRHTAKAGRDVAMWSVETEHARSWPCCTQPPCAVSLAACALPPRAHAAGRDPPGGGRRRRALAPAGAPARRPRTPRPCAARGSSLRLHRAGAHARVVPCLRGVGVLKANPGAPFDALTPCPARRRTLTCCSSQPPWR